MDITNDLGEVPVPTGMKKIELTYLYPGNIGGLQHFAVLGLFSSGKAHISMNEPANRDLGLLHVMNSSFAQLSMQMAEQVRQQGEQAQKNESRIIIPSGLPPLPENGGPPR